MIFFLEKSIESSFRGIVANVLNYDIVVSEFELQSPYSLSVLYHWESYEPSDPPPIYGLNSTPVVLQGYH